MRRELVVVGAGPAGLAAARAAASCGVTVTVVDRAQHVGGQIYRARSVDPLASPLPARLAGALVDPRIEIHLGAEIWRARITDGTVLFELVDGRQLAADAAVLATGAIERCVPFPGWDLPGVLTAGGAQALVKGQGVVPGNRVLVAGTGPLLLPVAASLAGAGAHVVGLLDANRVRPPIAMARHPAKLREAAGYLKSLVRRGIRPRLGHAVVACEGTDRVTSAVIARVDADWQPVPGTECRVAVDAVCVSYGFVPALELPRALGCAGGSDVEHDANQVTSVPNVCIAGGSGGAALAELEGHLAGLSAARSLGVLADRDFPDRSAEVRPPLARERRFADLIESMYPLPAGWRHWLRDDTIVCRCEETRWSDVQRAVAAGGTSVRTVKGLTRAGMGYCQGRVCGPALQQLLGGDAGDLQTRHIGVPVPLSQLADSDPPTEPA